MEQVIIVLRISASSATTEDPVIVIALAMTTLSVVTHVLTSSAQTLYCKAPAVRDKLMGKRDCYGLAF
jgi:hypothetical protein